jgi:hypothetical protein
MRRIMISLIKCYGGFGTAESIHALCFINFQIGKREERFTSIYTSSVMSEIGKYEGHFTSSHTSSV